MVEPRLALELVDVDDWIEFILASIGERLLLLLLPPLLRISGDEAPPAAGLGLLGTGELPHEGDGVAAADVAVEAARQFSSDEKEGVGLAMGLG